MAERYGFHVDLRACTGCKACQIACKDKNGLPVGVSWRRVIEVSGGAWQQRDGLWIDETLSYFVSVACMHCEQPICVEACPTRAIYQREDGIVLIRTERCMGCRYCEWACPYGAPRYDAAARVMTKCDLCADELDAGRLPACVASCQMRVLELRPLSDLKADADARADLFPLPDETLTRPALRLTPHADAARARAAGARIGNRDELE